MSNIGISRSTVYYLFVVVLLCPLVLDDRLELVEEDCVLDVPVLVLDQLVALGVVDMAEAQQAGLGSLDHYLFLLLAWKKRK